jgi:CBS domain containing-hemolysin-like protein
VPPLGFAASDSLLWLALGPVAFLFSLGGAALWRAGAARRPGLATPLLPILRLLFLIAAPIRRSVATVLPIEDGPSTVLAEDALERIEEASADRPLDVTEQELLHRLSVFGDTTVRDAMTPRVDVFRLPANVAPAVLERAIREGGHSRVPIYEDDKDNVIGLLYVKDVVGELGAPDFDLRRHLRKPRFVPLAKRVDELFREFHRDRVHVALVVDEYGALAGIVTMEDVLAQLFGEIRGGNGDLAIETLDARSWRVSGRLALRRFEEMVDADLGGRRRGTATVAGLVVGRLGRLPREGDRVQLGDFVATVEEVDGFALERLRIER